MKIGRIISSLEPFIQVAQVVAYELGVDMKYIVIQPVKSITNANARGTNGSITSELVCLVRGWPFHTTFSLGKLSGTRCLGC